jgi:hypothetical protein
MTMIDDSLEMRLADHEGRIAELAGSLNLVNAQLVHVVAEVLADESWAGPGVHSPTQWLTYRAGVSPERARDIVKVAERRADFPMLMRAFDAGELSVEQTAVLVGAPAWADRLLLDWGKVATVARLRKTIRTTWFTGDPDAEADDHPPTEDRDRVSTHVTDDHRWRINGELDLGRGELCESALREARESLFERGHADITEADCLVEICERYLDGITSPIRRERSKTWLHLDVTEGAATTTDGWRLPASVRDHVLCDGLVQPVWERDGVPFSVGRSRRTVPERTRRIVRRRDQGCRVPGCTHDRFVEIHHLVHWLAGGPTDTWNLLSMCPKHHRLHHLGLLGITGNADEPDGVVFTDRLGRVMEPVGAPVVSDDPVPRPDPAYRPPLMGKVDYNYVGLGWIHPNAIRRRLEAMGFGTSRKPDHDPTDPNAP